MLLDLADLQIRARVSRIAGGARLRLVLEYPPDAQYPERVYAAFSDLLRPPSYPAKAVPRRKSAPAKAEASQ